MATSTESTQVGKVLVVEDEMVLRMRAVDVVEDAGFGAVEAVNADEAIAVLESRSDIALLFTDIPSHSPQRSSPWSLSSHELQREKNLAGLTP